MEKPIHDYFGTFARHRRRVGRCTPIKLFNRIMRNRPLGASPFLDPGKLARRVSAYTNKLRHQRLEKTAEAAPKQPLPNSRT